MCGVFGYIGHRSNAALLVFEGLKRLEYRGYDSWGVVVVGRGKIYVKKKTGKIGGATVDELPPGSLAIGHTRWATHGGVTEKNAHPHLDCTHTIAVIHNGIVENYESIQAELVHAGHRFVSETDTEIIAHLLEFYAHNMSFIEAFVKTFQRLEGLNAIVAIHHKERVLVAAKKGSPLVIGFGKKENFIASDPSALLPHTKEVYFLEDGQMAVLRDASVSVMESASQKVVKFSTQILDWDVSQTHKGEFHHFMLKEIYEQPQVVLGIAGSGGEEVKRIVSLIRKTKDLYFVGCGSASYACLAGAYLFSKIAQRRAHAIAGSEFLYHLDFINTKSVVVALSQSGETIDTLESVSYAKRKGAKIVALVNVLGSSLYRVADAKILIGAGPEKAVASTKAFIGKIAHLILLAYALDKRVKEGQELLRKSAEVIREVLAEKNSDRIKKLAHRICGVNHIFILGRGLSYSASLECAMKIKEISYIHAEGLAAGELKHGTLALVEKGTPCIVLLPNDETYAATLAGAMEIKARGGYIIGISPKKEGVFDEYLPIADVGDASMIPMVVTGQLLAYYLALERGLDPDMPRNLAKSVTVR
ncbi:MAG: glutamine--fructose-6-phosphate transaminase (isomerizing) [Candidatus Pacebacteria bacterium]|nr:glutamine--fructose-6-phosphate transaminase (isomerizing) [Candidatus Paceibacterota bacterium]